MPNTPKYAPVLMLFSRLLLFLGLQALLALGFALAGAPAAWEASANWWPLIVAATNAIGLVLLIRLFRAEGLRYRDAFRVERKSMARDLLLLLATFLIGGPLAVIPNILLGGWLFGDPNATLALFLRPLPLWAAWAGILLFPLSQGLVELGTYFAYVMPRFERQGMHPLLALALPATLLSLQHLTMPLLFDVRFILWRALMYLPFAFFCGILLRWRPRWLPYLAAIHALMNLGFAISFLSVAY